MKKIQWVYCIVCILVLFVAPKSAQAAEACFCNTTVASMVVVPYDSQELCEVFASRPHPSEDDVMVLNCVWGDPSTMILSLEPAEEINPSFSTPSPSQNNDPNIQQIRSSLRSLNKLSAPNIPQLIGQGLRLFTGVFGSIALVMVIYGGLQIMLARGQSDKVKGGINVILWASIGLVTMLLSYALVNFVFGAVL